MKGSHAPESLMNSRNMLWVSGRRSTNTEHTNAARMMSIRTLENQRSGDCLLVYPSNSNNLPVIYTSVPTTKEEFKVSRDVY